MSSKDRAVSIFGYYGDENWEDTFSKGLALRLRARGFEVGYQFSTVDLDAFLEHIRLVASTAGPRAGRVIIVIDRGNRVSGDNRDGWNVALGPVKDLFPHALILLLSGGVGNDKHLTKLGDRQIMVDKISLGRDGFGKMINLIKNSLDQQMD